MAVIKQTKKKKEYVENHDILVTHGEEALTFRKDDPRTQEYLEKKKEDNLKQLKEEGSVNLWAGICLSNERQDKEGWDEYKDRLKTNKNLWKIYKKLGNEEAKKQFPHGFAYAVYYDMQKHYEKTHDEKDQQFTATVDGPDGKQENIPVIIKNNKK
tara:strand:- start:1118 stop:1585 length:468 start_codon:yes stop_codon:yes gene_type:complete